MRGFQASNTDLNLQLERQAVSWACAIVNCILEKQVLGWLFIKWQTAAAWFDRYCCAIQSSQRLRLTIAGSLIRFACRHLMRPFVGRRAFALIDFLNSLPAHSAIMTPQGMIVATNEAWLSQELRHYYDALALKANCNFFSQMPSLANGTVRVARGELPEHHQQFSIGSGDSTRWLQLIVVPLGVDSHEFQILLLFKDISDWQSVSQTLSASDRKLSITNELPGASKVTIQSDGTLRQIDLAGLHLINAITEKFVIGQSWLQYLPTEDREEFTRAMNAIMGGGAEIVRHRFSVPDCCERWLETTLKRSESSRECDPIFVAESSDITAWRQAETELLHCQNQFEDFLFREETAPTGTLAHKRAISSLMPKLQAPTNAVRIALLEASPSSTFDHRFWKRVFNYLQSVQYTSVPEQIEALEKTIASGGGLIDDFYNLAFLYWTNGELAKARWAWEKMRRIRYEWWTKHCANFPSVRLLAHHWISNIGHYLLTAAYVKLSKLGMVDATDFYLYLNPNTPIGNKYLMDLFDEHINFIRSDSDKAAIPAEVPWLFPEDNFYLLPKGYRCGLHIIEATTLALNKWRQAGLVDNILRRLPITTAYEEFKRNNNIGPNDWFAVLHVRAPGFAGASVRDARIDDYTKALRFITKMGGKIVRIGDRSMPPAPKLEGLIDYALAESQDPSIDALLCANCRFFIGGPSGPGYVPPLFGKPCLYVNWAPALVRPVNTDGWYLPKTYHQNDDQSPMHIDSIISSSLGGVEAPEMLNRAGITVCDNTADQILEAVEIFYRHEIDGIALGSEDSEMQQHFEKVSRQAGTIGAGKVIPSFVRQFPTVSGWLSDRNPTNGPQSELPKNTRSAPS